MTRVSELLGERMDLALEPPELDGPDEPQEPQMSDFELIARLREAGAVIANEVDLQPPTRLRHLHTIDQVIRRLRK